MKLKLLFSAALVGVLGIGALQARVWTSSDGKKTFEGDFKSYDEAGNKVTVLMRNGRTVTFDISKLSDADQTFAKEQQAGGADAGGGAEMEEFAGTDIGKALRKMEILDGSRYKKHEFTAPPEYFILYYTASW